jgi:hypothetical protein
MRPHEPRQGAVRTEQMILSRNVVETLRPQTVGERTWGFVGEAGSGKEIGHRRELELHKMQIKSSRLYASKMRRDEIEVHVQADFRIKIHHLSNWLTFSLRIEQRRPADLDRDSEV